MSDASNSRDIKFIVVVGAAVVLALALVSAGVYFYTQPESPAPRDETESLQTDTAEAVTPESLKQTINQQLDQLEAGDFDQSSLSDQALGIN